MTVTIVQYFNGAPEHAYQHRVSTLRGLRRVIRKYATTNGWSVGVRMTAGQLLKLGGYRSQYGEPILGEFSDGGRVHVVVLPS